MALEIFRLVGSVFVDTDAANKSLKNTDKEAGKLGQSLVNGIKAVGTFAAGVATTVAGVGAGIVALTESTREYRTEQGKLTTAFETQNFTAEQARSTYEALNGILGDSGQAVEAANHLALLADNEKELATWTDICTGVYATFGDSLPIENLTEAANETAKTGALTGGLADALNWAGINEDKFQESLDACANEQERQALITETLNGLYSDAADKYREVNGEVIAANKAQDKLNQTTANIGKALEPVVTKGKELFADVLQKATPLITELGEVAVPLLATAFDGLVEWISQAVQWFQDAYTWMTENQTAVTLIAIALGTLTAAIVAWNIAQNAATIATTIATAATTAWGAVMAFVTSPVTLVVAAIGALIAIIVLLVQNWDTVKAAAVSCWEWIKGAWSAAAEWFNTKVVQPIANFFSNLWASVTSGFATAWQTIKDVFSSVVGWIKENWTTILLALVNPVAAVFKYCYEHFDGFRNFVDGVVAAVGKFFKDMWSGLTNGAKNAWQGVKDTFSKVSDWFKDVFSKAWTAVKNVFSTGGKVFDGIKEGIANVFKTTVNAIIRGINKVISVPFNALNKILSNIKNISVAGVSPFSWVPTLSVPEIPQLAEGGVLERGQVGLLEGNGAEAVVPLHNNRQWISAVARDMDNALGGSSGGQVVALLMDILEAIEELSGLGIFLDKDKLVGELAKPMDKKLGQLQAAKARG